MLSCGPLTRDIEDFRDRYTGYTVTGATGEAVVAVVGTWVAVAIVVFVVAELQPLVVAVVVVVVVVVVAVAVVVVAAAVASSWAWAVPEDDNSCCFPVVAFPAVVAAGGTWS